MLKKNDKIFLAGHRGLVGSAIGRRLADSGYENIITRDRKDLDLLDQNKVRDFFATEKPDAVFIAAAKVGGILANNTFRSDFLYENLVIQNNLIWSSHQNDVETLVFLGSSCIYPKLCPQPMREEFLLGGPLEFTNRPYALAKIAGLELINTLVLQYGRRYFSAMPTNLYGPGDNFHAENSHVLPALIRKFHEAKQEGRSETIIWGTGKPKREFLFSEDCADAVVYLAENLSEDFYQEQMKTDEKYFHINVGSGQELSIRELAELISDVVGYKGDIVSDPSKPDGTPRKLLDSSKLFNLGWKPNTELRAGIAAAYQDFMSNGL